MRFGGISVSSLRVAKFSELGGRIAVPVKPSQVLYAQYHHISGISAASSQKSLPLTRLRLLNSLLEGLKRAKKNPVLQPLAESPPKVEALIQQYAKELHQTIKSSPEFFSSFATASSTMGMVFDLSV